MTGYAICASHCTHKAALSVLKRIVAMGEDVVPIISERALATDTRFGRGEDLKRQAEEICGRDAVTQIRDAELFGAHKPLDFLVVSPCTGNTLAKLASGISDSVVTLAAKAHLRCDRPLLISLSTNDALSQNLQNIAAMLLRKSVYFAPMHQDAPRDKPHSLVMVEDDTFDAYFAMKRGEQLRPLFR